MPSPLPTPRFDDPGATVVWCAICALDEGLQHEVLEALRLRLAIPEGRDTPRAVKIAACVGALREAREILGRSPSVEDFRRLRTDRHPEWPSDGTVRNVLGGGWNDALRRARLDAVPEADVVLTAAGNRFRQSEAAAAIADCARELQAIPTFAQYLAWARRQDVRARPGARPRSQNVFERLFGSWQGALVAAGLIPSEGGSIALADDSQRVRSGYRFSDEVLASVLQEMVQILGRPPRTTEFAHLRERLIQEARERGEVRIVPSYHAYRSRYATWDDALVAAGLPALGGRGDGARRPGPRESSRRITDALITETMREAYAALGDPFTATAYKKWRLEQQRRDAQERRFRTIPSYYPILERFGSWEAACQALLGGGQERRAA